MTPKLLNIDDCDALSIQEVHQLYRDHINPGLVEMISTFSSGWDLVEKAEGAWIYTKSGKKILDYTGGVGVLTHGHNHPRLLKSRIDFQNKQRMEVHKTYFSPYMAALAHNIAALLPGDLTYSFFPNSGAEAVEGAVKMAYKYHEGSRKYILHADISFHGKLLGSGGLTGSPESHFQFPRIPHIASFEYNHIESLRHQIQNLKREDGTSDIYAIIIEPMSASSMRACSESFLLELRHLCTKNDILLIFDEVYTGWAKTGHLFYFMRYDLIPDILINSKSLGGGKSSIAGYTARKDVFSKAYGNLNDANLHSTTYNGFGEETVTALEAIQIIVDDQYVNRAQQIYQHLHPKLLELQKKYPDLIQDIRGSGALLGILMNLDQTYFKRLAKLVPSSMTQDDRFLQKIAAGALVNGLYERFGIMIFFGQNREIPLIISPPLVTTDDELSYFITSLDEVLKRGITRLTTDFVKSKFFSKLFPGLKKASIQE